MKTATEQPDYSAEQEVAQLRAVNADLLATLERAKFYLDSPLASPLNPREIRETIATAIAKAKTQAHATLLLKLCGCGGAPMSYETQGFWHICCRNCGIETSGAHSHETAIEFWNAAMSARS